MIKTARQLKDLIRNLSRKNAANAQILMRNYMMERFLERISLSKYKDKFILKGGMLVAAMVGMNVRSTMDMDATIKGIDINIDNAKKLISEIIAVPLYDGVTFQVKNISEIMDEAEYPGVRVTMTTFFDNVRTPLKIDISTGDIITPGEVQYSFKQLLHDALLATAQKRGTEKYLMEAIEVFDEVGNSPLMQSLWTAYQKNFSYAADLSWSTVMAAVCELYSSCQKQNFSKNRIPYLTPPTPPPNPASSSRPPV